MTIIHIFKDGTTTNELKNVYVPDEIVRNIARIAEKAQKRKGEQNNEQVK